MYFESDLYLLQQLLFPNARTVALLDPEQLVKRNYRSAGFVDVADQTQIQNIAQLESGLVLINLSNIPVEQYPFREEAVEGIISFCKKGEFYKTFTRDTLYYVLNDLKTFRWVFPNNLRYPFFLRYYDAGAAYGNLFRGFCALSGLFRQLKWIADGRFYVLHQGELFFDNLGGKQYDGFTLFFKEHYYTGIGLLQLINNNQLTSYAKLPVTKKGKARTSTENKVLSALNQQVFRNFRVPRSDEEGSLLVLSNTLSLKHKSYPWFKPQHFRAIGEYTRSFARTASVESFLKQESALEKLALLGRHIKDEQLPRGISAVNLSRLYQVMTQMINNLPLAHEITLSLVHGDFTEENCSIEQDQLVLMDWEFARFDFPALGDFIDFICYRLEDEGKPELAEFERYWQRLATQTAFQELCKEFAEAYFLQFKVYLLVKILNYWRFHLNDAFLPYYINWRIHFWKTLLEALAEEKAELR